MSGSSSNERVHVKTTVPKLQKEQWVEDAETLEMSQSEFVRTMVQAGRSAIDGFVLEGPPSPSDPWGNKLETVVLEALTEPLTFDELEDRCTDQFPNLLEEIVADLHERGAIDYTPRGKITSVE